MRRISINSISINAILVMVITATAFLASCSKRDDNIDLFDGLPPRLATLLVESDDSTLTLYARETGLETFVEAKRHFETLIQNMSQQNYLRHADILYPLQKRLSMVLAQEFDYDFCLNDLEFLQTFSPIERQEIMIKRANIWLTSYEPDLTYETRIDSLHGYSTTMAGIPDTYGVAIANMTLSCMYGAIGDRKREKSYLIDANNGFVELGFDRMICQALGVLGTIYEREGKVDSMEICYQTARELAIKSHLSDQISRFSYFYARRYSRMGRLALANDLFNEAIELCKKYKGGCLEIRFILHAMEFYADNSCWETVERMLARAKILDKIYEDSRYSNRFSLGIKIMEARLHMAHGEVKKANSLFSETKELNKTEPNFVNPDDHLYYWSKGLLDNGLAAEAIEIINHGLVNSRQKAQPREEIKFLTLKASAELEIGNVAEARKTIERFDAISPELKNPLMHEWITRDVIRAKIAMTEDDMTGALACVEEGLGRLRSFVDLMDISVQGYLWINECIELRRLMHELIAYDPKLGYGAELFWRSLPLNIGTKKTDPNTSYALALNATIGSGIAARPYPDGSFVDYLGTLTEKAISYMRELDAIHCMYIMDNNHITRFTLSPDGIQRATIPCTREELHSLVIETHKCMSGEEYTNGTADSADVHNNLSKLSQYLLPDDLYKYARPGTPRTLLITTDDFLSRIPFETFNIGSGGEYIPLLKDFDVAYLRYFETRNAPIRSDNPGIIIVNSHSSKSARNRFPFGRRLSFVKAEGQAVAALDKNAILLKGLDATKHEIMNRWEEASYLYFATHIMRDPEIPFLVLIPLETPEGSSSPESGYLDFTDIRSADFSRCNVVVLSGCSSGAPSVSTRNIGPSLGDAFLDAGAAVVISTFWDVKDEEAQTLMTSYARKLRTGGQSNIKALCGARRMLFNENPDSRNSFSWASYAVHTGGLKR